jgi:hypothetical protein
MNNKKELITPKYMSANKAKEVLKVNIHTLYNLAKDGKIETRRTAGRQSVYNVQKYLDTYANPEYDEKIDENIR